MDCFQSYRIKHFDTLDSTNAEAHRMVASGVDGNGLLLWADYQQAGRGQTGNHWESDAGKNLLLTLCVRPTFLQSKNQFLLSEVVSLAACTTLNDQVGGFVVKWPNDIYYDVKKVCGILIELTLTSAYVAQSFIGIGINVNQDLFNSDAPNPVSLKQITGKTFDREELLHLFLHYFDYYYNKLERCQYQHIRQEYKEMLFRREGMHPYRDTNGLFMAQIVDVLQDGHLILRDEENRERRYMFKEVECVL
ncbi:MAG: biotin--[Bacteroidaceae bacterium]|nr:biotin--[acetyl-CoA-carboxylase] ligase [Bacteroidaceae bacterium]